MPILLLATPPFAHNRSSDTDKIVGTPTRSARSLADVPASASVITSDDIEEPPVQIVLGGGATSTPLRRTSFP